MKVTECCSGAVHTVSGCNPMNVIQSVKIISALTSNICR